MRKILLTLGVSLLMVTAICAQDITLNINNKIVSTPEAPMIETGTTLVPLRVIGENLGAKVDWDEKARMITITKGEEEIKLTLKSKTMTVNNKDQQILLAPKLVKGTTMVPIRIISETLDSWVDWDSKGQEVVVSANIMGGQKRIYKVMPVFTDDGGQGEYKGQVTVDNGAYILNGYGILTESDGTNYRGGFKDGKYNGKGREAVIQGDFVEGNYLDGALTGKGKMELSNGATIHGNFLDGIFVGKGTIMVPNGDTMEVEFKDGIPIL